MTPVYPLAIWHQSIHLPLCQHQTLPPFAIYLTFSTFLCLHPPPSLTPSVYPSVCPPTVRLIPDLMKMDEPASSWPLCQMTQIAHIILFHPRYVFIIWLLFGLYSLCLFFQENGEARLKKKKKKNGRITIFLVSFDFSPVRNQISSRAKLQPVVLQFYICCRKVPGKIKRMWVIIIIFFFPRFDVWHIHFT